MTTCCLCLNALASRKQVSFDSGARGLSFTWHNARHQEKAIDQPEQPQTALHVVAARDTVMATVAGTRPRPILLPTIILPQEAVEAVGAVAAGQAVLGRAGQNPARLCSTPLQK
jgi:hypothetical protein